MAGTQTRYLIARQGGSSRRTINFLRAAANSVRYPVLIVLVLPEPFSIAPEFLDGSLHWMLVSVVVFDFFFKRAGRAIEKCTEIAATR